MVKNRLKFNQTLNFNFLSQYLRGISWIKTSREESHSLFQASWSRLGTSIWEEGPHLNRRDNFRNMRLGTAYYKHVKSGHFRLWPCKTWDPKQAYVQEHEQTDGSWCRSMKHVSFVSWSITVTTRRHMARIPATIARPCCNGYVACSARAHETHARVSRQTNRRWINEILTDCPN